MSAVMLQEFEALAQSRRDALEAEISRLRAELLAFVGGSVPAASAGPGIASPEAEGLSLGNALSAAEAQLLAEDIEAMAAAEVDPLDRLSDAELSDLTGGEHSFDAESAIYQAGAASGQVIPADFPGNEYDVLAALEMAGTAFECTSVDGSLAEPWLVKDLAAVCEGAGVSSVQDLPANAPAEWVVKVDQWATGRAIRERGMGYANKHFGRYSGKNAHRAGNRSRGSVSADLKNILARAQARNSAEQGAA